MKELLPPPADLSKYRRENSIEFEEKLPVKVSPSIRFDKQNMLGFVDGQWSGATQLLCVGGRPGDFVTFEFDGLENCSYQMVVYATMASDYGIVSFSVNGEEDSVKLDGYHSKVTLSDPISLGEHIPNEGVLTLKVCLLGTNPKTTGDRFLFGLDGIQLLKRE